MAAPRPPPPKGFHYERDGGKTTLVRDSAPGVGWPTTLATAHLPNGVAALLVSVVKGPEGRYEMQGVAVRNVGEDPHENCETCAEADRLMERFGIQCPQ